MSIRETLIHWLGGVTEQECRESDENSWLMGRASACVGIIEHMKALNGLPAEEWARKTWLCVNRELAFCTKDTELLDRCEKGEV